MGRLSTVLAIACTLAALAGCSSSTPPPEPQRQERFAPTPFHFNVTLVDDKYSPSEPSIVADPKGNLWIAGPTGFATPLATLKPQPYTYDSGLFVSRDGGATWSWVNPIPGYGRDACVGGGDSDIAAAPDGALFLIDLNLAEVPIDVSTDGGQTWLFNCFPLDVPVNDRQWVAADDKSVWIQVSLTGTLYRADRMGLPTDGLVFLGPFTTPCGGPMVVDPQGGILYLAGSGSSICYSTDRGQTFQTAPTGLSGHDLSGGFVSIALDAQGNVFVAGAGQEGLVISGSQDRGATWTEATVFAPYGTNRSAEYAYSWVAAGGNATVDMAWYGQPPHDNGTAYHLYALQKTDFFANPADANATWTQVTTEPIATKPLCAGFGLVPPAPCDADGTHTRALGDFFETAVDQEGHFIIAFNDANNHNPTQLKFAKQVDGVLAPPRKAA